MKKGAICQDKISKSHQTALLISLTSIPSRDINVRPVERKKGRGAAQIHKKNRFLIFVNENCSRRPLDCSRVYNYFVANQWIPTQKVTKADIILIFTCGSFQMTEERSLRTIKMVQEKKARSASLIVTGCLTKIHREALQGSYKVILPEDLDELDTIIKARVKLSEMSPTNAIAKMRDLTPVPMIKRFKQILDFSPAVVIKITRLLLRRFKYRFLFEQKFYIKIAHGCAGTCTYCAIKIACGDLRSINPEAIVSEFKKGLAKGYKTFVLVAEDTGCYGLDLDTNIVSLLHGLLSKKGDFKLIIRDFKPNWLIRYYDSLAPLLEKHKNKIGGITLPIQSGSNRILELMKRQYNIDDVKACIKDLKKRIPELSLYTQIITGFPGETEDDFEQTRKLIRDLEFTDFDLYCYEDRPGTASAAMPEKIPEEIKLRRRKALYKQYTKKFSLFSS
jgi:MiaB/RimO family radical SAM methylthiotransferase